MAHLQTDNAAHHIPSPVVSVARLLVLCALIMVALLSSLPKGSTLFFTWPWIFYGQLLLLLPIALLGWQLITNPESWRRSWNGLGYAALAVGLSVACSRRPAFSLEAALFLWSGLAWCGLAALATHRVLRTDTASLLQTLRVFRVIGVIIFIPLLSSLALWSADLGESATRTGGFRYVIMHITSFRNPHPQGHWNYTGGYALLASAWLAALVWVEKGRWRPFWGIGLMLSCIILFSASSRGAVLGALISMVAAGAMVSTRLRWSKRQIVTIGLSGLAITSALVMTQPRLRSIVLAPSSAFTPSEGDVQRIGMLQGGWLLAQKSPWIGHGPGMTPFVYPEVRAKLIGGVETSYQLHNGPLQLLVDSGIVGLICWLLLGILLVFAAIRWWRSVDICNGVRPFALCCTAGLAGYFGVFLTDYQFNVVPIVGMVGLYAGVIFASPADSKSLYSPMIARYSGGILVLLSFLALIPLIPAWRARHAFWSAWWESSSATDPLVMQQLRKAVCLTPNNPYYRNQLAFQLVLDSRSTTEGSIAQSLMTEARQQLLQSLQHDAAQEPVHAALGWIFLDEDPQKAKEHFQAAVTLLPDRDTLHLGLAFCNTALGLQDEAVHELALECLVNPFFVTSPLWSNAAIVSLRERTIVLLLKLYQRAYDNPAMPAWRRPQIVYATAFTRWWYGGPPPSTEELKGSTSYQQNFYQSLHSQSFGASANTPDIITVLSTALRSPDHAEAVLSVHPNILSQEAKKGALARISTGAAKDLTELLRSTAPNGIGLVQLTVKRAHFNIMNRVMDGPGLLDLAPRIQDSFQVEVIGDLIPQRGVVPGPVLSELIQSR